LIVNGGGVLEPADLELIHLTKRYGPTTAVDSIDLKVPTGAYCCLLGPSGCGKTSTLRMIAGHERDRRRHSHQPNQRHRPAASQARHGDDVPELRAFTVTYLCRKFLRLAQDEGRR
jgi:ABC-type branched-subunit amino acid transport system ATPase component